MDRFSRVAITLIVVLLAGYVAQPYIERSLYGTTTPRTVTPRADLADFEKATVELFERVAPSVGPPGGNGTTSLIGRLG